MNRSNSLVAGIIAQLFLNTAISAESTPEKFEKSIFESSGPIKSLSIDSGIWIGIYLLEQHHNPTQGRDLFTQSFDEQTRDLIHGEDRSPIYTDSEKKWRTYSDSMITLLIGGTIATPIIQEKQLRKLLPISRAFVLNNFASVSIKHLVSRKRPKDYTFSEVNQFGDNYMSFPSGHSSNAFVAASSFQELTPDLPTGIHSFVYALAGSVSIARIKGDRHYFTDVLAGALMGTAISKFAFSDSELCESIAFEHQPRFGNSHENYRVSAILSRF